MLLPQSVVTAAPESEVVSCSLAGEAALLHLRHGAYYGLDSVGAYVWELIQPGLTFAEIRDALVRRFDVDIERCERDLHALIDQMSQADLVSTKPAS